jgi:hypothetical protein
MVAFFHVTFESTSGPFYLNAEASCIKNTTLIDTKTKWTLWAFVLVCEHIMFFVVC